MDAAVLGSFEHYARLYPGDILGSWVVGWPVVYSVLVCPAGGGKGNRHWALLGRNCNSILFSTGSGSSPGGGSARIGIEWHFWALLGRNYSILFSTGSGGSGPRLAVRGGESE